MASSRLGMAPPLPSNTSTLRSAPSGPASTNGDPGFGGLWGRSPPHLCVILHVLIPAVLRGRTGLRPRTGGSDSQDLVLGRTLSATSCGGKLRPRIAVDDQRIWRIPQSAPVRPLGHGMITGRTRFTQNGFSAPTGGGRPLRQRPVSGHWRRRKEVGLAAVRRSMDPTSSMAALHARSVLLAAILMPLTVLSTGPLTAQATLTASRLEDQLDQLNWSPTSSSSSTTRATRPPAHPLPQGPAGAGQRGRVRPQAPEGPGGQGLAAYVQASLQRRGRRARLRRPGRGHRPRAGAGAAGRERRRPDGPARRRRQALGERRRNLVAAEKAQAAGGRPPPGQEGRGGAGRRQDPALLSRMRPTALLGPSRPLSRALARRRRWRRWRGQRRWSPTPGPRCASLLGYGGAGPGCFDCSG